MPFSVGTGILTPEELKVVHGVYSKIASEEWFTVSAERRGQFAALVIDLYRSGISDPSELEAECRSVALERFGNGGVSR